MGNEEILSNRYRKFLLTGIWRTILTTSFSVLYVLYISRNISFEIQDKMIILATAQLLIIKIALLGTSYSLVQQSQIRELSYNQINDIGFSIGVIMLPFVIIISVFSSYYVGLSLMNMILYVSMVIISFFFEIFCVVSNSKIENHKEIIIRTIYSILNSVLVASFLIYYQDILMVLIAWILSFLGSTLIFIKELYVLVFNSKIRISETINIIKFGAPIFMLSIFNYLTNEIDKFLIYEFLASGETAGYYWISKFIIIFQQLILNIIVGILPLFAVIVKRDTEEIFYEKINRIFRIGIFVSIVYFFTIIYQRETIILLILSELYLEYSELFFILLLSAVFTIPNSILNNVFSSVGDRKKMIIIGFVGALSKIIGILLFIRVGVIGFGYAILFQKIIGLILQYLLLGRKIELSGSVMRILLFGVLYIFVILITPYNFSLEILYYQIIHIFALIVIFIIIKPLELDDILFVMKILNINPKYILKIKKYFR